MGGMIKRRKSHKIFTFGVEKEYGKVKQNGNFEKLGVES